jgi:peroxiredoxin
MPTPGERAPALEVTTTDGAPWRLADRSPASFTLVVAYRGLHCPICSRYVKGLADMVVAFAERGVEVIALSTDDAARAARAKAEWQLDGLTVGHGLSIEQARAWGLYVSSSRGATSAGVEEPRLFNEPGLFLIRPDGTLYLAMVQSVPFARPHLDELLSAIDFVQAKDYPPRGTA